MTASLKGHSRAVEVLKAKDALGELAEEVSLPKGISQEMKERIQTRAQQELEVEKTLESIDSSKSLRDICAEKGGTPEMCERFPLEKFESFAQIEAYCLEQGGPQEACASLEAKCKEFGVTDANECFIVLSTASITTYQSAELKTVPAIEATPIPEEVIEQRREQERTRIQEPVQIERAPIKTESEPPQISKPVISKVIIYTAQSCPHCQEAKQWLQANGISYEEFDVSENEEKQNELMEKAGQLAVPVIEAGSEIIIGFNESRLSELLGVN
jgi:glutaredoxin-like YruB-family protein